MEKFALILKKHNRLGYLFVPWIVGKQQGYFILKSRVSEKLLSRIEADNAVKQVFELTEEYDEHLLSRIFDNRRLNIKEFWQKTDDKKISNHIRPYIEKRLGKIFQLLKDYSIDLFLLTDKTDKHVYEEDRLQIYNGATGTIFNFEKRESGTRYYLSLNTEDEDINLFERDGFVVSNDPCIVCVENNLMSFEQINGNKLLPFFSKEYIEVPESMENKYYSGFIRNSIRDFTVRNKGFDVVAVHRDRDAILSVETDFKNEYHFILSFRYDKRKILANDVQKVFVDFEKVNRKYIFYRLERDFVWEDKMASILTEYHLGESPKGIFKPKTDYTGEQQKNLFITIVNRISNSLIQNGFIVEQNLYKKEYLLEEVELDISESKSYRGTDYFGINATVIAGKYRIPFIRFCNNILKGNKEYVLPDGRILVLPDKWFAEYRDLLQFSEEKDGKILLKKIHLQLLSESLPDIASKYSHLVSSKNDHTERLPKDLKGKLRLYQVQGYSWLVSLYRLGFGACLADDMGLGKTIQTIALLLRNKELITEKPVNKDVSEKKENLVQLDLFSGIDHDTNTIFYNPSLVVAPKSLIFNWLEEFAKFAPSLKVKVLTSGILSRFSDFQGYDVFLITYGLLRKHVATLKEFLFEYIILDESQNIKNPASLTYQAVMQCKASHRIILTGTPVENSLTDLWAQMNFINPGLLGSLNFFKKEFVNTKGHSVNSEKQEKLSKMIFPFLMRRTKSEVEKDLPSLTIQNVMTEMTDEQAKYYDLIKVKTRNALFELYETGKKNKSSILVLQGIMKLRLAANHPVLTDENYSFSSGKFEDSLTLISTILEEEHKVLIFSTFVKHLYLFAESFKNRNISFEMLTGSDSQNARMQKVRRFQSDKGCRIFLVSLKAGGTGLNLTAADYVILLDPWWNPAAERQAIDRVHRIGQDKKVIAYKLITKDSIEEKIFQYQKQKIILAENILTADEGLIKNLTDDQIRELFA